jgi:hypothetical protein
MALEMGLGQWRIEYGKWKMAKSADDYPPSSILHLPVLD